MQTLTLTQVLLIHDTYYNIYLTWHNYVQVTIYTTVSTASVHDELEVCEASPLDPVVLDVGRPHLEYKKISWNSLTALTPNTDRALNVHEHPRLGTLELHHHDGAEVAALVAVRVVVAGEPAERRVRHLVKYFY